MAAQMNYSFSTPKGVAGGLYDISNHEVVTRLNEEEDGKLGFGIGVVRGINSGQSVKLPDVYSISNQFEGIVINGVNVEQDMLGKVIVKKDSSIGVLRTGKVWVKVSDSTQNVKYGDNLHLIVSGPESGFFTNKAEDGSTLVIKGKFIGEVDNGIVPILLPNELN